MSPYNRKLFPYAWIFDAGRVKKGALFPPFQSPEISRYESHRCIFLPILLPIHVFHVRHLTFPLSPLRFPVWSYRHRDERIQADLNKLYDVPPAKPSSSSSSSGPTDWPHRQGTAAAGEAGRGGRRRGQVMQATLSFFYSYVTQLGAAPVA